MKTSKETTALEQLTNRDLSIVSGKESLDVYLQEIGWNLRSLMRQADMLDTAILEIKQELPQQAAAEALAKKSA
jgi:hypothetical protein